jgi:AMMECR1 domain-containing protein
VAPADRRPAGKRRRREPGVDGVLLEWGSHRATFLPQVWALGRFSATAFLDALIEKAGLSPGFWSPELKLHTYRSCSWKSTCPGPRS